MIDRYPRNQEPSPEDLIAFAYSTHARFAYYKAISAYNGKSSDALDEGIIAQMEVAVELVGRGLIGLPLVATLQVEDRTFDRKLYGIGIDTDSGIIVDVRQDPNDDPENVSLSVVKQIRPRS